MRSEMNIAPGELSLKQLRDIAKGPVVLRLADDSRQRIAAARSKYGRYGRYGR